MGFAHLLGSTAPHKNGLRIKLGLRRVAQLPGQSAHGGGAAEPSAALLPHGSHQRPVAARAARLRRTAWTTAADRKNISARVLEAYRKTPGTMGTVRRADRMLAAQLYQRGVSVRVVENALAGCHAAPDPPGRSAASGCDSFAGIFPP